MRNEYRKFNEDIESSWNTAVAVISINCVLWILNEVETVLFFMTFGRILKFTLNHINESFVSKSAILSLMATTTVTKSIPEDFTLTEWIETLVDLCVPCDTYIGRCDEAPVPFREPHRTPAHDTHMTLLLLLLLLLPTLLLLSVYVSTGTSFRMN